MGEDPGSATEAADSWVSRGGSSRSWRRFDLSNVDSGKSGETSGACLPTGMVEEGTAAVQERKKGCRSNEPPVTCTAAGVEMSDLSARARWRVSSPVDQPVASCLFPTHIV